MGGKKHKNEKREGKQEKKNGKYRGRLKKDSKKSGREKRENEKTAVKKRGGERKLKEVEEIEINKYKNDFPLNFRWTRTSEPHVHV